MLVLLIVQEKVAAADPARGPKRYHFDRWELDTGARELVRKVGISYGFRLIDSASIHAGMRNS